MHFYPENNNTEDHYNNMFPSNNNNHISVFVRFFDVTPLGQILNRFSADTNIIDQVRNNQQLFHLFICLLSS